MHFEFILQILRLEVSYADVKKIPSGGKNFCVGREKLFRPDADLKVGCTVCSLG